MPTLGYLSLIIIWAAASAVGLVLSLIVTNPLQIGPVGVTVWFLVLFTGSTAVFTTILYAVKSFLHIHGISSARLRYSWRQGLLLGGWVTGVLALSSLHQFNLRDAILLGLLLGIIEVYVRLRWP